MIQFSKNTRQFRIIYFWKPLLWLAIICYALFIPAGDLPKSNLFNIPDFDKLVHFVLFFVLNMLLLRPFKRMKFNYYLVTPVISFVISGLLEFGQHSLSKTRASDILDFTANTLGIVASLAFYYLFVSNRKWEKLF